MEVHHHPKVTKKNVIEYLLEFLMIFLAVTLGFIAENVREKHTERTHSTEYLETYRDELKQHLNLINTYMKIFQNKIIVCDSIKTIYYNGEENKKIDVLKRLMIPGIMLIDIPFNTSCYDQIVNSGALRNINNRNLRDSMASYKGYIESNKTYNNLIQQSIIHNTGEVSKFVDMHDIISTDTSISYTSSKHIPEIRPFNPLSFEQRNFIVFFYESYIIQAQSDLRRIRNMDLFNRKLQAMLQDELNK